MVLKLRSLSLNLELWIEYSLTMVNSNLVSTFDEKWHSETNSFHLPFGEMIVTLDDVGVKLDIHITGHFFSSSIDMNVYMAIAAKVELLWVSYGDALAHTQSTRGTHFKLNWLND